MNMKKLCLLGIAFLFVIAAVCAAYGSRRDIQAGVVKAENETLSQAQDDKHVRIKITFEGKEAIAELQDNGLVGISSKPCR
ncbi:hypothetical protein [Sporomusa acidovorans]|uniref:Uncharacterized protein n=1 Tax=Sporomusa acidovorans (strain ATCC 49682 / DSM 3132 / Mol) TaxID=1123286 RepID=A0ABZ3J1F0_SPOA4|nr:hypothetical protein [Sporomusa acidovorans]OZC24153.1 hypothetical protein SPACI_01890 [Sporomusa acidovorans DSM 3132]SDF37401.1 hypothetical protein SAMN04488499_104618 [Sporomusa acidovorans]